MSLLSKKYSLLCVVLFILFSGVNISCNAYFESKKKPESDNLSQEVRELLNVSTSSVEGNLHFKKNIGDIESDLQVLLQIPKNQITRYCQVLKETGAHGKIYRMEVKISPPYPDKMSVEVHILPRGGINYAEYPVKIEGKVIQDEKLIGTFKTVLTGAVGGDIIPVPTEAMFPMRFEFHLWDSVPSESFSTLIYTQSKLSLYPPFTDPKKIMEGDKSLTPLEETEMLGNPLRITLLKGEEVK